MELIIIQHYGGNTFLFYRTKRKDIFMTINERTKKYEED